MLTKEQPGIQLRLVTESELLSMWLKGKMWQVAAAMVFFGGGGGAQEDHWRMLTSERSSGAGRCCWGTVCWFSGSPPIWAHRVMSGQMTGRSACAFRDMLYDRQVSNAWDAEEVSDDDMSGGQNGSDSEGLADSKDSDSEVDGVRHGLQFLLFGPRVPGSQGAWSASLPWDPKGSSWVAVLQPH